MCVGKALRCEEPLNKALKINLFKVSRRRSGSGIEPCIHELIQTHATHLTSNPIYSGNSVTFSYVMQHLENLSKIFVRKNFFLLENDRFLTSQYLMTTITNRSLSMVKILVFCAL